MTAPADYCWTGLDADLTRPSACRVAVCRPVLNQYVHTREEFQGYARELFDLVRGGGGDGGAEGLRLAVHGEYPLSTEGIRQSQEDISAFSLSGLTRRETREADQELRIAASRKTSGKLIVKVA